MAFWLWMGKPPRPENKGPDVVACRKCGHVVLQSSAKEVESCGWLGTNTDLEYYCSGCRPLFDKVVHGSPMNMLPTRYYKKWVPVEQDGTPVGYQKIDPLEGVRMKP